MSCIHPRGNPQRPSPARQIIRTEEGNLILIHAGQLALRFTHHGRVQRIAGKEYRNMLLRHILPEGILPVQHAARGATA